MDFQILAIKNCEIKIDNFDNAAMITLSEWKGIVDDNTKKKKPNFL